MSDKKTRGLTPEIARTLALWANEQVGWMADNITPEEGLFAVGYLAALVVDVGCGDDPESRMEGLSRIVEVASKSNETMATLRQIGEAFEQLIAEAKAAKADHN